MATWEKALAPPRVCQRSRCRLPPCGVREVAVAALRVCVCVCLERNSARTPALTTVKGATHKEAGAWTAACLCVDVRCGAECHYR